MKLINYFVMTTINTLAMFSALLLTLTSNSYSQNLHTPIFQGIYDNTYKVYTDFYYKEGGTGFILKLNSGKKVFMTAAHVCGDKKVLALEVKDGLGLTMDVAKVNYEYDLCILTFPPDFTFKGGGISVAKQKYDFEVIYTVSYTAMQYLHVQAGVLLFEHTLNTYLGIAKRNEVNGKNKRYTYSCYMGSIKPTFDLKNPFICTQKTTVNETTIDTYPGNSGGAVVNKYGKLVGVVQSTNRQGKGAIVRLIDIKDFVKNYEQQTK